MGLKPDWKKAVARHDRSLTPSSASTSSQVSSPTAALTSTPKNAGAAHRTANIKHTRRQDSLEIIGGFTDTDVTVGLIPGNRNSYGHMVQIVGHQPVPEPAATNKRRAKSTVFDEKSLSVHSLPDFVKLHWKSVFVPTLIHYIGQIVQPWSFASGKEPAEDGLLIELVQRLVSTFWPDENHIVSGGSKIYRIVSLRHSSTVSSTHIS